VQDVATAETMACPRATPSVEELGNGCDCVGPRVMCIAHRGSRSNRKLEGLAIE
jgi:hypothetical protein